MKFKSTEANMLNDDENFVFIFYEGGVIMKEQTRSNISENTERINVYIEMIREKGVLK